jgi:uncharacterized protein YciU (UPF0263 family)
MAWTVTPNVSSEDGSLVGFDAQSHNEGFGKHSEHDYVVDNTGKTHHVMEDVELREDESTFNFEQYEQDLLTMYPQSSAALDWAPGNIHRDVIEKFNTAVDNQDLDTINETLDYIMNQYRENTGVEEQMYEGEDDEEYGEEFTGTLEEEIDNLDPEDVLAINEAVQELESSEPMGEDVAEQWQEYVDAALEGGNEVYAGIAAAAAAFHSGEISADAAIKYVLNNYPIADVARAYQEMNQ